MIVFHDLNETSTFPPGQSHPCPNLFTLRDFCIPESPLRSFSCLTVESFGVHGSRMKKMRGAFFKKKRTIILSRFVHLFQGPSFWGPPAVSFWGCVSKNIPERLEALLKNALMISLKASFRLSKLNYTREKLTWQ